jgi:transposase
MDYVRGVPRDQVMLLPAAVEDYVSAANPVRAIDAFVDALDLTKLGLSLRDHGARGRASYHPRVLLKLYLWGYFSRTRSSRRLEEACQTNLNAIWLTGNLQPDHSTISDFRKVHGKPLKQIFKQFNVLCLELGLFGKELVAIDGSFIKAVNSKSRSFTKNKLTLMLKSIEGAVSKYLTQLDAADGDEQAVPHAKEEGAKKLQDKIEKLKKRREKLEGLLEECGQSPTGQVNQTDPDSRQLCKRGQSTVGYNVQTAVDEKHHLVASCEVTQEPNDMRLLDKMSQQAKEDLGLEEDAELQVLADTGYGSPREFTACEEHNTKAIVPMQKTPVAGDGTYSEEDFAYQSESDSYQCPQGKSLIRKADDLRDTGSGYRVYYDAKQCRGCPMLGHCTSGKYRKLRISIHKDAVEAVEARRRENPQLYRKRSSLVEHPFGTLKDWTGGKDLLCCGLELAAAETGLNFWAYNFKRVLRVIGMEDLLEGIRAWGAAATA